MGVVDVIAMLLKWCLEILGLLSLLIMLLELAERSSDLVVCFYLLLWLLLLQS